MFLFRPLTIILLDLGTNISLQEIPQWLSIKNQPAIQETQEMQV